MNTVTLVYPRRLIEGLEFNGTFSTVRLYRAFRSYSLRFESSSDKLMPDQTRVVSGGHGIATFPALLACKCGLTNWSPL